MEHIPIDPGSHHNHINNEMNKGVFLVGFFTPIIAAIVSFLQSFEGWLRVISLLIGISVGVQALYRNRKKKDKHKRRYSNWVR